METAPTLDDVNPFDPEFLANPFPIYTRLVQAPPVRYSRGLTAIVVARYHDVKSVLRDSETYSNHRPWQDLDVYGGVRSMIGADPPVHTRLRKMVSRDFTAYRIAAIGPRIAEMTDHLLDGIEAKGEFDVIADLANVLPVLVIAEILGISAERRREFKIWSNAIAASLAVSPLLPRPPEAIEAAIAMRAFLADEIERRRQTPGPDLISALIANQEAGMLTEAELLANLLGLMLAGNETTTNLIGNGLLALVRFPDQRERLRSDASLIGSAIEEMLRFDGPVQAVPRIAKKPAEIDGIKVEAGMPVFALLGAANRDPAIFDHPEAFDIARNPDEHLAFAYGIHYCIGAQLARLEGAIAITKVLERFPRLALADDVRLVYKSSLILRGLSALPMKIR